MTKEFEDDDPMELQAVFLPLGNPEDQARCFIEEFAMMGMSAQKITELFSDPFYSGTHRLAEIVGMSRIVELIEVVIPTQER